MPKVMLPEEEEVKYVVVWQRSFKVEMLKHSEEDGLNFETLKDSFVAQRGDVVVEPMEGKGLCRSRNRGIEVAMSLLSDRLEDAVFVIADDDERQTRQLQAGKIIEIPVNEEMIVIVLAHLLRLAPDRP